MSKWTMARSNAGRGGAKGRFILNWYSVLRAVLVPTLLIFNHFANFQNLAYRSGHYEFSFWWTLLTCFVVPILVGIICNLERLLKALRLRRFRLDLGCCIGALIALIHCLTLRAAAPSLALYYCLFLFLFGIVKGAEEDGPPRRVLW